MLGWNDDCGMQSGTLLGTCPDGEAIDSYRPYAGYRFSSTAPDGRNESDMVVLGVVAIVPCSIVADIFVFDLINKKGNVKGCAFLIKVPR